MSPGAVRWPGRTVWGEVLDPTEIDVGCELPPDQADAVAVGQAATLQPEGRMDACCTGRVVCVGLEADRESRRVAVLVRLTNPGGRLRTGVRVRVQFGGPAAP